MLSFYLTLIDTEEEQLRFVKLYEKYRKLMHYVAKDIVKDKHLAEDAVQEAFLRIAKNFHSVGEIDCPQTKHFVVIIVRRVSLTLLKKESLYREKTYFDFSSSMSEDENDNEKDMASDALNFNDGSIFDTVNYHLLLQEILQLPEKYQEVLYFVGAYECSMAETADLLNLTKETVKKRMQRGRKLLLERLEESNRE